MTPDVSFHFALNSFVLSAEQNETKPDCYFFGTTFLGQLLSLSPNFPYISYMSLVTTIPHKYVPSPASISFQVMGCHCLG
jgi:hypothetical protein